MKPYAEKTIEGARYEMRPMDPLTVLEHGSKLTSELAAPALERLSAAGKLTADSATVMSVGAALVAEALKRFSHPAVQAALIECLRYASVNGRELEQTWRVHFLGKPKELVMFFAFALEAQFSGFFVGLGEQVVGALKERFASLASQEGKQE